MRRTLVAGVVAAALVGVAGCGADEPRPKIAEPTASPTATPTGRADLDNPEDAISTWIAGYNSLSATGDKSEVAAATAPKCQSCEQLIEPIADFYVAGGRIEEGMWSLEGMERDPGFEQNQKVVVTVLAARGRTVEENGTTTGFPSESNDLEFTLMRDGESWIVKRVAYL